LAAGFKKGDEVIVPAQTHTATAHAVEYTGAKAFLLMLISNYRKYKFKRN
jgi:dTDP-4-amino-4,6-dideoxygalactose transaminase